MVFTSRLARTLAVAVAVAAVLPTGDALPRVHPSVHRTLRQQGTVNLIVKLKQTTTEVVSSIHEAEYADRGAKIESLVDKLESLAASSQAELAKVIAQESVGPQPLFESTQSFWISNQVSFKGASFELVEKLSALTSIGEIREELVLPPPSVGVADTNSTVGVNELARSEWGVGKIQAPEVWAAGFNGTGAVVGSIDTGFLASQSLIASKWRSSFGWYDPLQLKFAPYDDNGHGTHTIGTIVGANGIGVAPVARMCAIRVVPNQPKGYRQGLLKGTEGHQQLVGGSQGDDYYAAAIQAWRAADIIPVFSIGDQLIGGPNGCETAFSPGDDPNVISVGAIDSSDALASFSLKGPSVVGAVVKPEISAPGVDIASSWIGSTLTQFAQTGTSRAAPHVTGVIALLLGRNPKLTFDEVKHYLTSSADRSTLQASDFTCGGTTDQDVPNNQFGYGRVNALNAMNALAQLPTPAPTPAPTPSAPS